MENNNHPLWMPSGSVRAILALMVIGTLCYAYLEQLEVPDRFWELGLLVAGAYFVQKILSVVTKTGKEKPEI